MDKCGTCFSYILDYLRDGFILYPPSSHLKQRINETLDDFGITKTKREKHFKEKKLDQNKEFRIDNKQLNISTQMIEFFKSVSENAKTKNEKANEKEIIQPDSSYKANFE